MEENRIQLSVLDIEQKYIVDPEETTYGGNMPPVRCLPMITPSV